MTTFQIVVIIMATATGAVVQGSTGVGLALIAGPLLVSIDGGFAPGPLLLAGQLIGLRHIVAEREDTDRAAMVHGLWGLPVGLAGGLIVLAVVSDRALAILVGSMTMVAAAALLAGMHVARSRPTDVATGMVCTFASVTAGLPGPPLAIAFSDMKPSTMRSTASMLVLAIATTGFVGLLVTGNFGAHELRLLGWLLPGIAIGLIGARWVRPLVDRNWFRPTILTIALLGGFGLVVRQFV